MNAVATEIPAADDLATGRSSQHARGLRHDWRLAEVEALFELPFIDLLYPRAAGAPRASRAERGAAVALLSIKTGGCPEDCGYCPQARAITPASRTRR